jgi:hypothetical protein
MITVRSILVEALNRSNLVPRRKSAPADMLESAFRLLKGIAGKFSNDNLLQFLVSEVGMVHDKKEYVLGETEDGVDTYLPVDVEAVDIQTVNRVYWSAKETEPRYETFVELSFASPDDFDAYPSGCSVYTFQPVNDRQVILKTKLLPSDGIRLKVLYNRKWDFGLDDELRIPVQYEELFITALTHKLALTFPRLSTEQVDRLEKDLGDMIKNVKTTTRAVKYLSRRRTTYGVSRADFISGRMFLPA